MATVRKPQKARSTGAAAPEKTIDGAIIADALVAAVKPLVKGLEIVKSKDGYSRYLRISVDGKPKTLARVTNRATLASVKIGSSAPVKLETVAQAKVDAMAERIAKRQDALRK